MAKESLSLEDKFLMGLKVLKKYTVRGLRRIDKEFGVSRYARKVALALGLKIITLAAPNAQVSLHAQNVQKKAVPQLLAKASEAKENPAYEEFIEFHRDIIIERQKAFATALWETLQENIYTVQQAEKKGERSRTKTLKEIFIAYKKDGISIDKQYFCASAGLGSLLQTIDDGKFEEYKLLAECLTNPNHCGRIIKDFKENFGNKKETSDIQKTLADIFKKNPYAVCIAFPRSKANSRSGYHYVTVFSNTLAVDSLITPEDSLKGKTARFNRTAISNTEDYFVGEKKKGYVFDITEMIGNYQIFEMFMDYLKKQESKDKKIRPVELFPVKTISFQPISQNNVPEDKSEDVLSWAAVGRKPISSEILLAKNSHRMV